MTKVKEEALQLELQMIQYSAIKASAKALS